MNKLKVLVTGCAGRIGSGVYRKLKGQFCVSGLDVEQNVHTDFRGSIADPQFLASLPTDFDAIVHIAALHSPHVGRRSETEFIDVNVRGTQLLAEWGRQQGVQHFVFLSTTALYGHASTIPGKTNWITEETIPQPRTIYHTTKLQAESFLNSFSLKTDIPVTVLRMSRCFPEPADKMAVYRLHRGVDVRDVATAHLCALQKRLAGFNRFNISGNTPFSPQDCGELYQGADRLIQRLTPALAAEFVKRGWNLPTSIDRVYDSTKAQQELGWRPEHGFEAVLERLDSGGSEVLIEV